MDSFLMQLENLPLSQWVLISIWGYPVLLTFHSLGLALLVGLLVIIDLRILGVARALPLSGLSRLMPWVWLGFTANAVSGVVLFMADARRDFYSNSFRWKMLSIVIGLAIAVYLNRNVLREDSAEIPALGRILAIVSLLSWAGAIVAGRLIAYLSPIA